MSSDSDKPSGVGSNRPNALKFSDSTKYTDVARTSSSSFKPPMSKDNLTKKVADTPRTDASWFSYIKTYFGNKPAVADASQIKKAAEKVKKTSNNIKDQPKKEEAKVAVVEKPKRTSPIHFGRDNWGPTILSDSKSVTEVSQQRSPRNSFTAEQATGKRNQPKPKPARNHSYDNLETWGPKYNQLRFVENKSTYLHTPEKKGTTSFRITTSNKVKNPPPPPVVKMPTKKKFSSPTLARKRSESPKKIPNGENATRLRSKSTPDPTSNAKQRPPYNPPPARRSSHILTEKAPRKSPILKKKFLDAKTSKKLKKETIPQQTNSLTGFFSNIIDGGNDDTTKTKPKTDTSPTRQAIESAMGAAMDAISTKITEIKTKVEESKSAGSLKTKQLSPPRSVNTQRSKSKEHIKETASDEKSSESPLKNTIAMISSLVTEKWSPSAESLTKLKDVPQQSSPPAPLFTDTDVSIHNRPADHHAYIKGNTGRRRARRTSSSENTPSPRVQSRTPSNSPGRAKKTPSLTKVESKRSFNDVLLSPKARKEKEAAMKSPKAETNPFRSTFSMLTSIMQEKLSPLMDRDFSSKKDDVDKKKEKPDPEEDLSSRSLSYLANKKAKKEDRQKSTKDNNAIPPRKSPVGVNLKVSKNMASSFLKSRSDHDEQRSVSTTKLAVSPKANSPSRHNF